MTTLPTQQIVAALQAGHPAEAERLARFSLQPRPQDENLLLLLALSLQQQQKLTDAVAVYAELTRLFPQNSLHWGNYATALRDAGDLKAAEEAYATALRLDPANTEQMLNYGLL